ncbi:MAG: hypothetical protein AB1521_01405 [Bacteroidota bacterium]
MEITRRSFIKYISIIPPLTTLGFKTKPTLNSDDKLTELLYEWNNPLREFSQAPFWFWNDDLSEKEIIKQIQDFSDHGVYGFIIHPRVGLPKEIGFMSDRLIYFMRVAVQEAEKNNMWCMLYDEGMYPSGSACGLIVAENPSYRPHGLFAIDLDEVKPGEQKFGFNIGSSGGVDLQKNQKLVTIVKRKTNGHRIAIVDRFINPEYSLIRGLHFVDSNAERSYDHKEVPEEMPRLADILNPDSVKCFIKIVYQRYYDEFKDHFGKTVKAIFTDEPSFFGKNPEEGAVPGNAGIISLVNDWLSEDFTVKLPALWYDDEPDSGTIRKKYYRALNARLEETYYKQLYDWCNEHNISLTGHPGQPDDIGHLRYFHVPGQDIVWRFVDMDKPNALEGAESTNAKCASSAMIHLKKRRNSNEYCGAYGHNFNFTEMKWLAHWLLIRGCNLLYPHAFYYSIRGPRVDERPPDVGPNNTWWNQFKPFTNSVSQICWLNTDSQHICDIAILGLNDYLPWRAAKVCFQNQYDFNYLEARHLWEDAVVDSEGIHIAGMNYKILIVEFDPPADAEKTIRQLEKNNRVIYWNQRDDEDLLAEQLSKIVDKDVTISPPCKDVRVRHVVKNGFHFYMIFNEGKNHITARITFQREGNYVVLHENTFDEEFSNGKEFHLSPHEFHVVLVKN